MSHQPTTTDTEEAKLQALKHLQHRLNLHTLHDLHQESGRLKNPAGTVIATATDTESLYYIAEAVNAFHQSHRRLPRPSRRKPRTKSQARALPSGPARAGEHHNNRLDGDKLNTEES